MADKIVDIVVTVKIPADDSRALSRVIAAIERGISTDEQRRQFLIYLDGYTPDGRRGAAAGGRGGAAMTGPEHYREAERLIAEANHVGHEDPQRGAGILTAAQVHATLALAAATALGVGQYTRCAVPDSDCADGAGTMTELLQRIYAAVDYMSELDGQDRSLVLEMSQAMLNDVIETGELKPMVEYVRMYCDVADGPDDIQRFADDI